MDAGECANVTPPRDQSIESVINLLSVIVYQDGLFVGISHTVLSQDKIRITPMYTNRRNNLEMWSSITPEGIANKRLFDLKWSHHAETRQGHHEVRERLQL